MCGDSMVNRSAKDAFVLGFPDEATNHASVVRDVEHGGVGDCTGKVMSRTRCFADGALSQVKCYPSATCSRSLCFMTLPVALRGSSATNQSWRGRL